MASAIRAILRTQNVGLAVTGGVLAFYYLSPDLSDVKHIKVPSGSLFDATESPATSSGQASTTICAFTLVWNFLPNGFCRQNKLQFRKGCSVKTLPKLFLIFFCTFCPRISVSQVAVKDCFVVSVPVESLRFPTASLEGGPLRPSEQHLDACIQDLANALVQCQAFKFEERILQILGLEEKFDIDLPAAAFGVGSKVRKFHRMARDSCPRGALE